LPGGRLLGVKILHHFTPVVENGVKFYTIGGKWWKMV